MEENHEGRNGSHFQESYMDVGEIAPKPQTNLTQMDFQDQGRSTHKQTKYKVCLVAWNVSKKPK